MHPRQRHVIHRAGGWRSAAANDDFPLPAPPTTATTGAPRIASTTGATANVTYRSVNRNNTDSVPGSNPNRAASSLARRLRPTNNTGL